MASRYAPAYSHPERETALLACLLSRGTNMLDMIAIDRDLQLGYLSVHDVENRSVPQFHRRMDSTMDRRLSINLFQGKRFSIGLGGPSDHFLMHSFHTKYDVDEDLRFVPSKFVDKNALTDTIHSAIIEGKSSRRVSNLGALSASFFEDHAKTSRRDSVASAATFASETSERETDEKEADDESVLSDAHDGEAEDNDKMKLLTSGPIIECAYPGLTASEIKEIVDAFTESMVKSQKSQQAIHDWDKKMGLKRSHSKTMRLTMRSRKKLKTMIKKDSGLIPR